MKKSIFLMAFLLVFLAAAIVAQERNDLPTAAKTAVSYGIVVDNSGSARKSLERIIKIIEEIVEANGEDDETFLVRFANSDKIRLVEEITRDKNKIRDSANDLSIDVGLAAIIDAVEFSANYLDENAAKEAGRKKALILITDGEEGKSSAKLEDIQKLLKEKDIKVFSIGISDEKVVRKVLDKLTAATGGKLFIPKNPAELTTATGELVGKMRL